MRAVAIEESEQQLMECYKNGKLLLSMIDLLFSIGSLFDELILQSNAFKLRFFVNFDMFLLATLAVVLH